MGAYLAATILSIISRGHPTILELLCFDAGKSLFTWLELGWKGILLILNWNNGIFLGDWVFSFLKDCGSVKNWKLLTGIEGIYHDRYFFFSSECAKADSRSKWPEIDKEGEDCDFWIFLASFKIYSGFETPKCNGEVGFPLVPIFLVAIVDTASLKSSLKDLLILLTSQNQLNDENPSKIYLQFCPRQRCQRCLC